MKALEILKRICNHGSATVIEIKESIEELEALDNRSCDSCAFNQDFRWCKVMDADNAFIDKGCELWESK